MMNNERLTGLVQEKVNSVVPLFNTVRVLTGHPGMMREDGTRGDANELREAFKGSIDFLNDGSLTEDMVDIIKQCIDNSQVVMREDFNNDPFLQKMKGVAGEVFPYKLTPMYNDVRRIHLVNVPNLEQIKNKELNILITDGGLESVGIAKNDKSIYSFITAVELYQYKEAIEKCTGNVLVYGLEVGYVPCMLSLKDDVTSVTVVSPDKKLIKLFNKFILPRFEHPEKIKIIKSDYLEHAGNLETDEYDSIFCDVVHTDDDIDTYWSMYHYVQGEAKYTYCGLEDFFILNAYSELIRLTVISQEEIQSEPMSPIRVRAMAYSALMNNGMIVDEETSQQYGEWFIRRLLDVDNIKQFF